MPERLNKHEVKLAKIETDIEHLTTTVVNGFKGVHHRQDVANGKLACHEKKLTHLEDMEERFVTREFLADKMSELKLSGLQDKLNSKQKVVWWIIGIIGTIISAVLLHYIIGG